MTNSPDASDEILVDVRERAGYDWICKFNYEFNRRLVADDPKYAGLMKSAAGEAVVRPIQNLRSRYYSLALANYWARLLKNLVRNSLRSQASRGPTFSEEMIVRPNDILTEAIKPSQLKRWAKMGLDLTFTDYDKLVRSMKNRKTKVLLLYNPSSYEIYREVLPPAVVDVAADEISAFQREALEEYSRSEGWAFCDLMDGFRERVRRGRRGLFSARDGFHWSGQGTTIATDVIFDCFQRVGVASGRGSWNTSDTGGVG